MLNTHKKTKINKEKTNKRTLTIVYIVREHTFETITSVDSTALQYPHCSQRSTAMLRKKEKLYKVTQRAVGKNKSFYWQKFQSTTD